MSTYVDRQVWSKTRHIPWPSELDDDDPWTDLEQLSFDRYEPVRESYRPARGFSGSLADLRPHRTRPVFQPSSFPTPILALDVDGPLNAFGMARKQLKRRGFVEVGWRDKVSYRSGSTWVPHTQLWLSRQVGDMLTEFSRAHDVELVWASLWEHNCNSIIAPALGLPRLPWVDFHGHPVRGLWKWPAVAKFADGRPLAWLDDGFAVPRKQRQCEAAGFRDVRRNLPTLLRYVDPAVGITKADLDAVASWLHTAKLAWGCC